MSCHFSQTSDFDWLAPLSKSLILFHFSSSDDYKEETEEVKVTTKGSSMHQHHQLNCGGGFGYWRERGAVVKAFIALTLFIHVVTCGWILISISNPESWLFTKGLITEIDLDYGPQNWEGENGFDGYLLNEFGENQT